LALAYAAPPIARQKRLQMKIALVTGSELAKKFVDELSQLGFNVINGSRAALVRLGRKGDLDRDLTEDELCTLLPECSLYVYGGLETATERALRTAKKLELIAFLGTGWSDPGCVDKAAAKKYSIRVTNTPHANAPSVAEVAMGLLLCLERGVVAMNNDTKRGGWKPLRKSDISGRRLGIVGLGHIGAALARHAIFGFGMQASYSGPNPKPELEKELGVARLPLGDLLAQSDYISIHTPASTTAGLITPSLVDKVQSHALILNLSAPEIINGPSLLSALKNGKIRGAAFDGLYSEPKSLRDEFLALPDERFIVLPRAAWLTDSSYERMATMALLSVRDVASGAARVRFQVLP
jgi:phosphoglycerate dehydrogenase-like enzyme